MFDPVALITSRPAVLLLAIGTDRISDPLGGKSSTFSSFASCFSRSPEEEEEKKEEEEEDDDAEDRMFDPVALITSRPAVLLLAIGQTEFPIFGMNNFPTSRVVRRRKI